MMEEENPFSRAYTTVPMERLIEVLSRPGVYDPLAVAAAQLELDRRNVDQESLAQQINDFKSSRVQEKKVPHFVKVVFPAVTRTHDILDGNLDHAPQQGRYLLPVAIACTAWYSLILLTMLVRLGSWISIGYFSAHTLIYFMVTTAPSSQACSSCCATEKHGTQWLLSSPFIR
jgi:hypothetical protein